MGLSLGLGPGEMAYLGGVLAAFVIFALVLAWAAHTEQHRH